jgi:6,7-dimethyl-8-ribityllumazine synthase
MPRVIEGKLVDPGGRFAIVAGRFNELITSRLIEGAVGAFSSLDIDPGTRVDVVWVPGAYEIPLVCMKLAESGSYAAVISLGAVIRGATSHYDVVAGEVAKGVSQAALRSGVPVIFGVLTTDTIEQALERAGTKAGNNGHKAAMTAVEMASLLQKLGS